jgi:hypothetical protein
VYDFTGQLHGTWHTQVGQDHKSDNPHRIVEMV